MQPMLYQSYTGQDLTGWLVSEKLNGVRAMWDGQRFLNRSGEEIHAPRWLTDGLPKIFLDGELYIGPDALGTMAGLSRKNAPNDPEWERVTFHPFDLPAHPGGYAERYRALLALGIPTTVYHYQCLGESWLAGMLGAVIKAGGEGLVARMPGGLYHSGERNQDVIKIKPGPETWHLPEN